MVLSVMVRLAIILAFGMALNSATAAASTQIQAAERVFDLLPPASHLRQIYGNDTLFPRPTSDLFYNTYRATFVEALAAKYSTVELAEFARSLAESQTIDVQLLEELNQPVSISLLRAMQKLATTEKPESSVDVRSTDQQLKDNAQE